MAVAIVRHVSASVARRCRSNPAACADFSSAAMSASDSEPLPGALVPRSLTTLSAASQSPGKWISVYANSGHTWMAIAGIAFDTSWSGNPSTWQPPGSGPRWRPDPTGNLADGLSYVVRHPPGL